MNDVLTKHILELDKIIKSKKYVKNNISLARLQCSKIFMIKEKLHIVIVSDILESPLLSSIEDIVINNGEIFLMFDGQYPVNLNKEDYMSYKNFFEKEEYENLFTGDVINYLERNDLILSNKGYYIATHEVIQNYEGMGYNKEESEKIREYYNLK